MSNVHERPRRIFSSAVAAFAVALLGLAMPSPAQAAPAHAWGAATVCVESQVGSEWR